MNVLVYGGYGNLGWEVVQALEQNQHQVFIIDQIGELNTENQRHPNYRGVNIYNLVKSCQEDKINIIIVLSEVASLSSIHSADPYINLSWTAQIAHYCATRPMGQTITMFIGIYHGLDSLRSHVNSNISFNSARLIRSQINRDFNKGNAVITNMEIPHIISPNQPASIFEGYLNRILSGLYDSRLIVFNSYELDSGGKARLHWNKAYKFAPDYLVANWIQSIVTKRSRSIQECPHGATTTIETYIGMIIHALDLEQIECYIDKIGPVIFPAYKESPRDEQQEKLREWIAWAIDKYESNYN